MFEMAKMISASAALFLALNLLFAFLVTADNPTSNPTPYHTLNSGSGGCGSGGSGSGGAGSGGSGSGGSGSRGTCPRDALKLGVCANLLGLVNVTVGSPPTLPCCSLLQGLVDLVAAVCLCTAIRANVLGINLNVPLSLSLVINDCGRRVPNGFQCA